MSKMGKKLITAANEAILVAKCHHKWERVAVRVRKGKVIGEVHTCSKCLARRTSYIKVKGG